MQLAIGTLSIIDGEAYAYTRIWCSFEVSMTLTDSGKTFVACVEAVVAVTFTDTDGDENTFFTRDSQLIWGDDTVDEVTYDVNHRTIEAAVDDDEYESTIEDDDAEVARVVSALMRLTEEIGVPMHFTNNKKLYEIVTFLPSSGRAIVISDGPTAEDEAQGDEQQWEHRGGEFAHQAERQQPFPPQLALEALKIRLQDGQATEEIDKRRILNSIAGSSDLDGAAPEEHSEYDKVNCMLRWRIGVACVEAAEATGQLKLSDLEEPEGVDTVGVYDEMATALEAQAKYPLALQFRERALAIDEKALGPDHEDVGIGLGNLGSLLQKMGRLEEALLLKERALAIAGQSA